MQKDNNKLLLPSIRLFIKNKLNLVKPGNQKKLYINSKKHQSKKL